jgi:16S rRNA (cytosine967-C5)-methyltransferase
MENNARQLAYDVLIDIQQNGAYANLALDKALLRSKLNKSDRRLATELVYGCTKMQLHLDQIIKSYCDLKKVDKKTLQLLRMAVYQMTYLEKIPDHAIINETVELSKKVGLHSDKFINGVLRSMLREEKPIKWPDKRKQRNQYIAKWYSFPQWLIDGWVKEYGFADTERLCEYFNNPAQTWIRVNTLKATAEEIKSVFEHLNIEYVQHPALPEAFCLKSLQKIKQSSLFKQGKIIVQDLSAMLPALVLNPSKGNQVLDMCAAPGGKTTYLSAIMNNSGSIMACDLHPHRVELIEHNVKRLGVENVRCYAGDATALPDDCYVRFDAVLLDAPCSGLGVLNRRADLRWRIRKSSLPEIEQLQEQLLDAACHYLKPQGTLVYSTCTLNKNENEYQIKRFLEKHPNFECVPFECLGETCESGQKTIYPYIDQTDGFFIAKLVRKE